VTLLLTALIAVLIRLDSPGPVFYCPKRVGENGRLFKMIKFRTMVENADQLRHLIDTVDEKGRVVQIKTPDDPRITRLGRFLRRTSLDEWPNFYNVLKGEMSLVGPRPEMPYLVDKYALWQRKRFAVPQGMTGWWQVNGRSDKPMYQHTEEDLYYVQHYSLWLDLQIIGKTVWVVLRGKGAY
jgi:lipopolysaccharide/colanic/teichoic acid biosynthesis glycosyltransferase